MKKIFLCILVSLFLSACASWQGGKPCTTHAMIPSFFAHDEQRVAFDFLVQVKDYELPGIMQIKKLSLNRYEVIAFSKVGGYRLLAGEITPQKTTYSFILKQADRAAVRNSLQRLWALLLFPPTQVGTCQYTDTGKVQIYQQPHPVRYLYTREQTLPSAAWYKKGWGKATLEFVRYSAYHTPLELLYQDGGVQVSFRLMRAK